MKAKTMNVKVSEQLMKRVADTAVEDYRTHTDQIRYLLHLGLLKREEDLRISGVVPGGFATESSHAIRR